MSVTELLFSLLVFAVPGAVMAYSAHLNRTVALEALAAALEHAAHGSDQVVRPRQLTESDV